MIRNVRIGTLVSLVSSLFFGSCGGFQMRDTWVPSLQTWRCAMSGLAYSETSWLDRDMLRLPDSVQARVDFLVIDLNRFMAVISWRYEDRGHYAAVSGQLTKRLGFYRSIHMHDMPNTAEIQKYDSLKAHDSLWTIVSPTKFWENNRGHWKDALTDPAWMYDEYQAYIQWEGAFLVDCSESRKK